MKLRYKSFYLILLLPFIAKILAVALMRGGGDAWNFNAIYQYLSNDKFSLFTPYLPASYVYIAFVGMLNDFFGYTYSFWQRITCVIFEFIGIIFTYKIAKKSLDKGRVYRAVLLLAYSPIAFLVV